MADLITASSVTGYIDNHDTAQLNLENVAREQDNQKVNGLGTRTYEENKKEIF